ncbi:MAG: acetate--CoA ligase family protein, partial [Firmicutes bacterium]|nr:acetate--CoA ligase family protein [Bacillota bacterium]
MKLFEYMGKDLFSQYGIDVPRGKMASTPGEAAAAAGEINGDVVVKSQILSGKRGKGGGILFAASPGEAEEAAARILGSTVQGLKVESVLVEEKIKIERELYLAITVDGSAKRPRR